MWHFYTMRHIYTDRQTDIKVKKADIALHGNPI